MGPVGDVSIEATMSALGQKQTCAVQKSMSALPPKADMCIATTDVRFGPRAVGWVLVADADLELLVWSPFASCGS